MPASIPAAELPTLVGQELGVSDWLLIDQDRVDAFADATLDHQFIHVDPDRAALTPFGGTIAHGFLTLSLLPHFLESAAVPVDGILMAINYGTDKVRFLQPVKVGQRVRGRSVLAAAAEPVAAVVMAFAPSFLHAPPGCRRASTSSAASGSSAGRAALTARVNIAAA